jgi:hypothetical protein
MQTRIPRIIANYGEDDGLWRLWPNVGAEVTKRKGARMAASGWKHIVYPAILSAFVLTGLQDFQEGES